MRKISYSQLVSYILCPNKWNLIYKQKIQEKIYTILPIFGTAMHETIQTFLYNYYHSSISSSKKINYELILKLNMILNYNNSYLKNKQSDFVTLLYLLLIYELGCEILKLIINKSSKYFQKKDVLLIGTLILLNYKIPEIEDTYFTGLIDILLYDKKQNKYNIIDLKTSRFKWNDAKKNDYNKRLQLILYKYFLSKERNIPLQNIDVLFLILKRKIFLSQFKVSRIQRVVPPNSERTCNISYNHVILLINNINQNCLNNLFIKKASLSNCMYCPANGHLEICDRKNIV